MDNDPTTSPAPGETVERFIRGPAGRLEASISAPRELDAPRGVCVVCHPHPLYGGTMTNKVVWTLASSALKCGLLVARFNYRGVGRSEGVYDDSRGETEDALAVVDTLRQMLPGRPLVLAGFSFGAYVSLKAAAPAKPAALVSIAVPFGHYVDAVEPPPHPQCPWLAVHSIDDDTVAYTSTREVLDGYDPPPEFVRFEGAGHFFHGRLGELQAVVQPFVQRAIASAAT